VNLEITGQDICDWFDGRPNMDKIQKLSNDTRLSLNKYLLKGRSGNFECGCSAHLIRNCPNERIPAVVHLGSSDASNHYRFFRPNVPGVEGEIPITSDDESSLSCISRKNGYIQARNNQFVLAEYVPPSRNGIFVNGEKIMLKDHSDGPERRVTLQHGDTILLGGNNSESRNNFFFIFQEAI